MNNKQTIGIMTFHRAMNYGAVWQCWALKTVCERLGYDVQTLDYSPYGLWRYWYFYKKRLDRAINKMSMLYHLNRFVKDCLNPTAYTDSAEEIRQWPQKDIYIVGSDQVWNPDSVGPYFSSYLLDFVVEGKRRIGYASSQGGVFATDENLDIIKRELPKYSAISLREPQFLEEMSVISGKNVVDVCDPTILLCKEDYRAVEQKKWCLPKHYIAVMDLSGDPFLKQVVKEVKKRLHLPVISIVGGYQKWANRFFLSLSPKQWLYVIDHADYMITNSFHGTALSILLETPFACCPKQQKNREAGNLRLTNILTQCGLMNQCVTDISQLETALHTDFQSAQSHIEQYRNRSYNWLKEALYETNEE